MIDHHRGTPETKSQNKNNSNLNSWRVNVYTGLSVFFCRLEQSEVWQWWGKYYEGILL